MSKSKSKGSAFERLVAKLIIDEFNKQGFKFVAEDCYRTPGSGGHVYASKQDPSDLVLSERLLYYFPFTIECKRDERFDLTHFYFPQREYQKSWKEPLAMLQVLTANKAFKNRYPMVVFQTNRNPVFCVTTVEAHNMLLGSVTVQERYTTFEFNGQAWTVCLFKPFLQVLVKRAQDL